MTFHRLVFLLYKRVYFLISFTFLPKQWKELKPDCLHGGVESAAELALFHNGAICPLRLPVGRQRDTTFVYLPPGCFRPPLFSSSSSIEIGILSVSPPISPLCIFQSVLPVP